MATTGRAKSQVIQLRYDEDGSVVVTPEDEDRFILTAQKAVRACQDQHQHEQAVKTFKSELIRPLRAWCRSHSEQVQACYIPLPAGSIQIFILGVSAEYSFELRKEVAQLELDLADKDWRVSVLQIPHSDGEDLQTYFDTEGALEIYAQLAAAQGQGDPQ